MKKEKIIRTYQRRTKTGKVVTVKQHTAKYDAAEALKEAAKKKGAGDELEKLKKKMPVGASEEEEYEKLVDAYLSDTDDSTRERLKKSMLKEFKKAKSKEERKELFDDVKDSIKVGREVKRVKAANKKFATSLKAERDYGFTADEYKAWYHWDQDADPKNAAAKKVEKALKAKMGAKGYKKYFDEMTDSYSSRGHNKAFKALDAEAMVPKKDAKTPKSSDSPLKVGSSIQMGNSTSLGKGKKETFKVLAVQKTNKQDRELGNTEAAWVQRKDGSVTLALKDSEKGWMYDDTWTDFTDRKHPYAKSLEAAGYSFKKAQGKGGKYWEVSKGKETKADSSKITTPNSIEEIAKAGLKRVSVRYGKGDKKSATYYTDGKQVYEPGEDGYLKKIAKNKMVPEARKLIDPPKSRASHKENSMGFSSLDWEASYGNGATGVDSDAAMRKIDKAARKYLGAKAYKKWAAYQDDSDDTGDSYKGFIKQLEKFKASEASGDSEKPRTKSVMTPHGRTTMISRKEIGTVGRTKYYQDSAGNVYKRNNRVGVSGDGMYSKLSGVKAKEVLGQLKSSDADKARGTAEVAKGSKSKTPRRGSEAAYEAAQKAKASLTSYIDASPYKRILKSMNTYGGQVNKNELIGKLVKKGLPHAEASKIAGQFATKVKTEFTKSRQYRPGAK